MLSRCANVRYNLPAHTPHRFVGHYLGRKVDREMPLETSDPEYRNFVEWFKAAHELYAVVPESK